MLYEAHKLTLKGMQVVYSTTYNLVVTLKTAQYLSSQDRQAIVWVSQVKFLLLVLLVDNFSC